MACVFRPRLSNRVVCAWADVCNKKLCRNEEYDITEERRSVTDRRLARSNSELH